MKSQNRKVQRACVNSQDNTAAEEPFLYCCRDCNGCKNNLSIAAVLNVMPMTALPERNLITSLVPQATLVKVLCVLYTIIEECMWCGVAKVQCSCKWVHTVVSMCLQGTGWESLPVVRLLSRMLWKALTPQCHISPFSLGDITSNIK